MRTWVDVMRRQRPPEPEPEGDDPALDKWVAEWASIGLRGFHRLLKSAALDAQLDEYLNQKKENPE